MGLPVTEVPVREETKNAAARYAGGKI
jgi:hypothetical protein